MSEQYQPTVVGKCPRCGQDVLEKKKLYECSTDRYAKDDNGNFSMTEGCGFKLWKTIAQKELPKSVVSELLAKGETAEKVCGFVSKAGKPFSCRLKLNGDKSGIDFIFDGQQPSAEQSKTEQSKTEPSQVEPSEPESSRPELSEPSEPEFEAPSDLPDLLNVEPDDDLLF